MNKHLLLTISDDHSALFGVRFTGFFFENLDELQITLFYTATTPEVVLHNTTDHRLSEQQARGREMRGKAALEYGKEVLMRHGFLEHQINSKLYFGTQSKTSDIILEADRGLYDAVVLGRRGVSWLEEAMGQSVTRDMLEASLGFPFWICRRPDPERANVLLCVDGSAPSLRMTDHVGFMLAHQPRHNITLLTVNNDNLNLDTEHIVTNCKEILYENGIPPNRVTACSTDSANVAATILEMADKGNYAVVALGRTGGTSLQRFFMGTTSSILFNQLTGAVLWICH